jgi:hypothetical protein
VPSCARIYLYCRVLSGLTQDPNFGRNVPCVISTLAKTTLIHRGKHLWAHQVLNQTTLSTEVACRHFDPKSRLRASSDYAQVERRSVTFMCQTMSRGEAFRLKKYIKIIQCQILNILMEKKVRPLNGSLGRPKLCSRGRTLGAIPF